jgi:hypothetical protein
LGGIFVFIGLGSTYSSRKFSPALQKNAEMITEGSEGSEGFSAVRSDWTLPLLPSLPSVKSYGGFWTYLTVA